MIETVVDGVQMQSNPFIVLTFIAAPAILTNASALMILSTGTRFARAVDRARELSRQIYAAQQEGGEGWLLKRLERELFASEERAVILLRVIRAFYFSLGGFAFAASVALLGAVLANFHPGTLQNLFAFVALVSVFLGVGGLVTGSVLLFWETRATVGLLQERVKLLQENKLY